MQHRIGRLRLRSERVVGIIGVNNSEDGKRSENISNIGGKKQDGGEDVVAIWWQQKRG